MSANEPAQPEPAIAVTPAVASQTDPAAPALSPQAQRPPYAARFQHNWALYATMACVVLLLALNVVRKSAPNLLPIDNSLRVDIENILFVLLCLSGLRAWVHARDARPR